MLTFVFLFWTLTSTPSFFMILQNCMDESCFCNFIWIDTLQFLCSKKFKKCLSAAQASDHNKLWINHIRNHPNYILNDFQGHRLDSTLMEPQEMHFWCCYRSIGGKNCSEQLAGKVIVSPGLRTQFWNLLLSNWNCCSMNIFNWYYLFLNIYRDLELSTSVDFHTRIHAMYMQEQCGYYVTYEEWWTWL